LGNLGIFETEVAAMAVAMALAKDDFDGEPYRLIMCEKFCNFCKCGTGFRAEFAYSQGLGRTARSPLHINLAHKFVSVNYKIV